MQSVKILACIAFIVFAGVQLATSLSCYECNSISACKTPQKVACTVANANQTAAELKKYYTTVKEDNKTNFDCIGTNFTSNGVAYSEVRGCIHREVNVCGTQLTAPSLNQTYCLKCSGDNCNGRSPAVMTTAFSAFTILTSILGLSFAKMLVH